MLSYRVQITPRAANGAAAGLHADADARVRRRRASSRSSSRASRSSSARPTRRSPATASEHGKQVSFLSRRHAHIFLQGRRRLHRGPRQHQRHLRRRRAPAGARGAAARTACCSRSAANTSPTGWASRRDRRAGCATRSASTGARGAAARRRQAGGAATRRPSSRRPTSFLDIFCVDEPEPKAQASRADGARRRRRAPANRQAGGRAARAGARSLMSEIASAFAGNERDGASGAALVERGAALVAVLAAVALGAVPVGPRRARAEGRTSSAASTHRPRRWRIRRLADEPDDVELRALATEAALKAHVPAWLAKLQARDFDGARGRARRHVGARQAQSRAAAAGRRAGVAGRPAKRLVSSRGGPDAPIRIYADEDRIAALIERWNDNTGEHQRALARIASYVPQFGDPYAEALTHLRKLQSDATVYLAAIERLKASIAAELNRDEPQALRAGAEGVRAEKYPGLGGPGQRAPGPGPLHRDSERSAQPRKLRPPARAGAQGALHDAAVPGALPCAVGEPAAAAEPSWCSSTPPPPRPGRKASTAAGAGRAAEDGQRAVGRSRRERAGAPAGRDGAVRGAAGVARVERLRRAAAGVSRHARSRARTSTSRAPPQADLDAAEGQACSRARKSR